METEIQIESYLVLINLFYIVVVLPWYIIKRNYNNRKKKNSFLDISKVNEKNREKNCGIKCNSPSRCFSHKQLITKYPAHNKIKFQKIDSLKAKQLMYAKELKLYDVKEQQ